MRDFRQPSVNGRGNGADTTVDWPAPARKSDADERAPSSRPEMIRIPGGTFRMGSDRHYSEEAPVHRVTVDPSCTDRTPLTNPEFRNFVRATGYVTLAELEPRAQAYP